MHANYFEGVLQLRNPTEEVLDFVDAQLASSGTVQLAKEQFHKDGVDLYLSQKRFIIQTGKLLQKRFGGLLKTSARLFSKSRLTSKEIHRVTVLFSLPAFKRGDLVLIGGRKLFVVKIGTFVHLKDVSSGKKVCLPFSRVESAVKLHGASDSLE